MGWHVSVLQMLEDKSTTYVWAIFPIAAASKLATPACEDGPRSKLHGSRWRVQAARERHPTTSKPGSGVSRSTMVRRPAMLKSDSVRLRPLTHWMGLTP